MIIEEQLCWGEIVSPHVFDVVEDGLKGVVWCS